MRGVEIADQMGARARFWVRVLFVMILVAISTLIGVGFVLGSYYG